MVVALGCEVDRVPFNRLVQGKKFLAADDPFRAADLFNESLVREPETVSEARAHLAVAYDQARLKVYGIPVERAKYEQKTDAALQLIADDPTAIAHMVGILSYHNVRSQSAESLLVSLGPVAVDPLLTDFAMKPEVRSTILGVFAQIGDPVVGGIERAVVRADLTAVELGELVRLLGSMPGPETEALLRQLRDDPSSDPGVRMEAVTALYRLGDKQDRQRLLVALGSESALVRRAGSYGMIHLNEAPEPSALTARLGDEDALVRLNLVRALGVHRGDPGVTADLIVVLRQDPNSDVANAAGDALGRYGPAVIDSVIDALLDEESWTRRQRLVRVLSAEQVRSGFAQQQEYRLYEQFEKREDNADVKRDLAQLLKDLESD